METMIPNRMSRGTALDITIRILETKQLKADPEEFTADIWADANSNNPIRRQTESRPDINRTLMGK